MCTRHALKNEPFYTHNGRKQEKCFTFSGSIQQKNGVAGIEPSSEGILVTETFPANIDWR